MRSPSLWTFIGTLAITTILLTIIDFGDRDGLLAILPHLGRIMGAVFALIFSVGIYITQRQEYLAPNIPLFDRKSLVYILTFCMSVMLPLATAVAKLEGYIFQVLVIVCLGLCAFCLGFIPIAFECFRDRFRPVRVFSFYYRKAMRNLEESTVWTVAWGCIEQMYRICISMPREDVDAFSGGADRIIRLLGAGVDEMEERQLKEIAIRGRKGVDTNEWIRMVKSRIMGIGRAVVDRPSAYERVAVQIIKGRGLSELPRHVLEMALGLCVYADRKNEQESLEKVLIYLLEWCEEKEVSRDAISVLRHLNNQDSLKRMIDYFRLLDDKYEKYFSKVALIGNGPRYTTTVGS